MSFQWDDRDDQAITLAKTLSADAVENAGSGHPGAPISLAAAAYLLYQRHMRFDPRDPEWIGRDRFVLSAGHASLLQYIQLYYAGSGLELEDLKQFRTFGSKTPGHPELGHTAGVEVTTGPLGTGFAAAVGMAMASRREHGLFDADTAMEDSPFDYNVYVIAGDGCMQEGVTSEAASLAGTQELGNLVVIYDDNQISIEDDTSISFNEDVLKRFEAYGWHTDRVDWRNAGGPGEYKEDVSALNDALNRAIAVKDKPSLIALSTIIGWPTPGKMDTGGIHGAALGAEALSGLKQELGVDPNAMFDVDESIVEHTRSNALERAAQARDAWEILFRRWAEENPDGVKLLHRLRKGFLPDGLADALPHFEEGKALATRAASGEVINSIAGVMPELWGGSADLAGSNNTLIKGEDSFFPEKRNSKEFTGNIFGRNLHFGVREHGMGAIMNGMAADGLTRVYGGTFFVFADFMRGAVRLAALMDLPVIYVWTHDSIGVGEDGPTHQPVEHLTAYRAIPNLAVVRPADAAETAQAWLGVLERRSPAALILSRQNVPNPPRGEGTDLADAQGVRRGAYVLADTVGQPDVILLASGSEVQHALAARQLLAEQNVAARVVSVPSLEWFQQQDSDYREEVLPPAVRARVSVEAGLALPWAPLLGEAGRSVSIESFGAPGAGDVLFEEFNITPEAVVAAAEESIAAAK